jgi:hypothetical protein
MSSGDPPTDRDTADARNRALARLEEARQICAAEPDASFENVWHTLILLELSPIERLNRGLLRGRAIAVQR